MSKVYDTRILLIQALTEARHLQLRTRSIILRTKNMNSIDEKFKMEIMKKLFIIDYILNVIIIKLERLARLSRPIATDIYLLVKLAGLISNYARIMPPETEYSASDLETLIGYIYSSSLNDRDKAYVESIYKDELLAQLKSIMHEAEESASHKLNYINIK